jgi:hypothetical protein
MTSKGGGVDQGAVEDRLRADALAVGLLGPTVFCLARTKVTREQVREYLSHRGRAYQDELGATEAQIEHATEAALKAWSAWSGWKPGKRSEIRTISVLWRAARKMLTPNGREMVLNCDLQDAGREIMRWRFVSLALPPSILMAGATPQQWPPPRGIRLLDPSLAPDSPVAQLHLHHSAMMSFDELWVALRLRLMFHRGKVIADIADKRSFCPQLHHERSCLGGRSDKERAAAKRRLPDRKLHLAQWSELLNQAVIAARVLELHAFHGTKLADCKDSVCKIGRAACRDLVRGRLDYKVGLGTTYPWRDQVWRLARRYREACAPSIVRRTNARQAELYKEEAYGERTMLVRAFEYVKPDGDASADEHYDEHYEVLLLQYLRVKCALFRLLVHSPGENGLKNFIDHFSQIKVYAPEADLKRPPPPDEPGLRVMATEYRIAPDVWPTLARRKDREIEEANAGLPHREAAWLIHFKRKDASKRVPLHVQSVKEMEGESRRIARSLRRQPRLLRDLRGVDLCGVEGSQPTWVVAETLRELRTESSRIAAQQPWLRLEPLRLTMHVGEDFSLLTSGLRAIAEPFEWNLLRRGDRIGHGIAITHDPLKWWQRKQGRVFKTTRIDRLLDLAFLATYGGEPSEGEEHWLDEQIRLTLRELGLITEKDRTERAELISQVKILWSRFGTRITRDFMKSPVLPDTGAERPVHEQWLHSYLWNRSTQERASEEIPFCVDDHRGPGSKASPFAERDLSIKARKRLIRQMARMQICVESNPSSNLVVAGLDTLTAQDFLQRRPTGRADRGDETLTWTISTDDPITFSTTLADEYAYAWAGMVMRENNPYDPAYARALLDEAAATSVRMRFTLPRDDAGNTQGRQPRPGVRPPSGR